MCPQDSHDTLFVPVVEYTVSTVRYRVRNFVQMSNGSWQGVSESSPQPEVDGEEPQAGYSSAMEPVKEAAEDENGIDDNEGNKKVVEGACADRLEMTDDGEEEDEDDDPLVQELKAELERTAFRQSSFGQQHVAKEKTPHEPPSSSSQAHYTSKIAYSITEKGNRPNPCAWMCSVCLVP